MGSSVKIDPQYDGIVMLSPEIIFFNDAQPRPDGRKIFHVFEQNEGLSLPDEISEAIDYEDFELNKSELFSKASENSLQYIQKILAENGIQIENWPTVPNGNPSLVSVKSPQTLLANMSLLNLGPSDLTSFHNGNNGFESSYSDCADENFIEDPSFSICTKSDSGKKDNPLDRRKSHRLKTHHKKSTQQKRKFGKRKKGTLKLDLKDPFAIDVDGKVIRRRIRNKSLKLEVKYLRKNKNLLTCGTTKSKLKIPIKRKSKSKSDCRKSLPSFCPSASPVHCESSFCPSASPDHSDSEPENISLKCHLCDTFILVSSFAAHRLKHYREIGKVVVPLKLDEEAEFLGFPFRKSVKPDEVRSQGRFKNTDLKVFGEHSNTLHGSGASKIITEVDKESENITSNEIRIKLFKCLLCNMRFSSKCLLIHHLKIYNLQNMIYCPLCGYGTTYRSYLNAHIRIHEGKQKFKCLWCDYITNYKSIFKVHLQTHIDKKLLLCPHCQFRASNVGALGTHMITHVADKPYTCSHCIYRCLQGTDMIRHLRVHTAEKVLHCFVCGFGCNHFDKFLRHVSHHEGTLMKCDFCSYKTYKGRYMISHLKGKHESDWNRTFLLQRKRSTTFEESEFELKANDGEVYATETDLIISLL